ncbi:MAG: hypothetical protein H6Q41_5547 [Deltaproteobacteria bacterium]|nr:hypothetical protein [Deltaproteobacteria bacterium]
MLSVHSGREIPWEPGIKGIADDDFPVSIRPALLEVVAAGDPVIIVACAARPLGTVGCAAVGGKGFPIEPLQNDLFVLGALGISRAKRNSV